MSKSKIHNSIHFILQGKGGVGKTFISSIIAQYLKSKDLNIKCIDTDPVNQSFSSYKSLNTEFLNIIEGSKIIERQFDILMEKLLTEDETFIIDNGASSFIPLSKYMIDNEAFPMLRESNKKVYIHMIITGGQGLMDTLNGFDALSKNIGNQKFIIWLNEYFGEIKSNDKNFEDMKVYDNHKDHILGIIHLKNEGKDSLKAQDIELVNTKKITFDEAINSPEFTIMAKQRIKVVQRGIFEQLDQVKF